MVFVTGCGEPIVERRHALGDAIIRIIDVVVNESFHFHVIEFDRMTRVVLEPTIYGLKQ
jgi:hypothetical protein